MGIDYVKKITDRITFDIFSHPLFIMVKRDDKSTTGRIYIQVKYHAVCTKSGRVEEWKGRKFYLSDHMIDDEIIKTCYLACKLAVEHEIMEGFKVDNIILFNPHINYETLLEVSHNEVKRS